MWQNKRITIVALLLALTGCDLGRSPEERINEARPVQAATLEARAALETSLLQDADGAAELQRELAARDKVRALTCAKGFSPSLFQSKEAIARNLPDQKCFEDYDRATLEWLRGRKLQRALAAGPLRAVPDRPVGIFATTYAVDMIAFATQSPIAACTSNRGVEIIDVGTGASLFLDGVLSQHPIAVALAPNGRVFAVGGVEGISLRDSQSGEVLLDLPDYQRFKWLDAQTGIAVGKRGQGVDLIDFANGARAVPVKGADGNLTRIVPLPGASAAFVLSGYRSVLRYELRRDAGGVQAILQDQRPGPPMTWSENAGEPTPDNTWFVQASSEMWITNLKTLASEQVPLRPFQARAVSPLPNPDEVLLLGSLPAGDTRPLVYSIASRTFAPVEDEQLTELRGYETRTVFIAALRRVAIVTGTKVRLLEDVKRGPRFGLDALVQVMAEEQRAQQDRAAREAAAREGIQVDRVVGGVAVASGPLLATAADAQVHAVGVYESSRGSHGPGRPSVPGPIDVQLRRSAKPIVLVLSSYEPVQWRLIGARSANLKAVLLSGYNTSTVSGNEGVQVLNIGRTYAYQQEGSGELQREVIKRTGRTFDSFQGTYSGSTFIVGGR